MSPRILVLTNAHQKLLADLRNTMDNLREQGKVWANGEDSAINLEGENLGLDGYVYSFSENGLNLLVWSIYEFQQFGRAESSPKEYSLSRCNITDLIDILASLETYGQATPDEAAKN